jgi:hypothetical protein
MMGFEPTTFCMATVPCTMVRRGRNTNDYAGSGLSTALDHTG